MNSKTIEKWQAARISQALFPLANYLIRLRTRMEKAGFPPDDDLFRHVCAAYDAMHRLRLKVHYLSCDGVGAPSKRPNEPPADDQPPT